MEQTDLISIVIPSYNREKLIKRAIQSVLNQTYKNLEIIVVDDCSTDNSIKQIKILQKEDPRIKLIINTENKGPNYTRNNGLKAAKGVYLSLLDSDDEWIPTTIELLWNKIKLAKAKTGLVYAGSTIYYNDQIREVFPKYKGRVFQDLLTRGTIGGYPLIKKEVFSKAGYFDEHEVLRRGGAQDYEMWIRIARFYEFETINKLVLNVYMNQDSVTYDTLVNNPMKKIRTYFYIWKKFKPYFENEEAIYIFFLYKIHELLCRGRKRKFARKTIFMALKRNYFKPRTYYHLLFFLHDFYSPLKFMGKIENIARNFKEYVERIKFRSGK